MLVNPSSFSLISIFRLPAVFDAGIKMAKCTQATIGWQHNIGALFQSERYDEGVRWSYKLYPVKKDLIWKEKKITRPHMKCNM